MNDMLTTNLPPHDVVAVQVESPIGRLAMAFHHDALCALALDGDTRTFGPTPVVAVADLTPAQARIVDAFARYFDGELLALDDVPVRATGSPFQQRVWEALRAIPVGATASYASLAAAIGVPAASRAVGRANATNPVPIVVPCHRVIRSDGSLGGYGGGLDRKRWLLAHERARTPTLSL